MPFCYKEVALNASGMGLDYDDLMRYISERHNKINCDCGLSYYKENKRRHLKTKKHLLFMSEKNNEKINEKIKEKINVKINVKINEKDKLNKKIQCECECGGRYTPSNKARHLKAKKHLLFMNKKMDEFIDDLIYE